ncbi:GH22922 [Drosophila grimshawi]|uniref:GH22922 n=2 Tax=Drosophila grimshawi TaxID=7222 RepID=B4JVU8_DROGR|nr:GH22922 [Drosophila grimshawi]
MNGTTTPATGSLSRGQCDYSFQSYALMRDRHTCVPDDEHIAHLSEAPQQRRPPILLKCLQRDLSQAGNDSDVHPSVLIPKTAKEILTLLKPIGNATKRHEAGSCVVMYFCTPFSLSCARVAKLVNLLPHMFPTLPIGYIDASQFTRFNAEFGIISLPTLMIFHQGRPLIKYDGDDNVVTFITRHTNIRPIDFHLIQPNFANGPVPTEPGHKTDLYLFLSWGFIIVCLGNYVRRTLFWKQLVEMVQRNWRESEETQMEMID